MDERTDKLQEQIEGRIFEEIREREQRRLNLVLHGVKELADSVVSIVGHRWSKKHRLYRYR